MKHKNITFSIPDDLKSILYAHVGNRGLSRFISEAIRQALKQEQLNKEEELDAAYEAANRDSSRLEILQDWNALDETSSWINEDENWDWLKTKNSHGNEE